MLILGLTHWRVKCINRDFAQCREITSFCDSFDAYTLQDSVVVVVVVWRSR